MSTRFWKKQCSLYLQVNQSDYDRSFRRFLCITGEASSSPSLLLSQSSCWHCLGCFFAARKFKGLRGDTGFLKLELELLRQSQTKPEQNKFIRIRLAPADVRVFNFCGENENPKPLAEDHAMDGRLLLAAALPNGAHCRFPHPELSLVTSPGGVFLVQEWEN